MVGHLLDIGQRARRHRRGAQERTPEGRRGRPGGIFGWGSGVGEEMRVGVGQLNRKGGMLMG
jgi:hypothetical protein